MNFLHEDAVILTGFKHLQVEASLEFLWFGYQWLSSVIILLHVN